MRFLLSAIAVVVFGATLAAQTSGPITWVGGYRLLINGNLEISLDGNIQTGWHIYSQHLPSDGPLPTKITFRENDAVMPVGPVIETGEATTFRDDIYEMYITWYSNHVKFTQEMNITSYPSHIRGQIEYMTCNTNICVSDTHHFTIRIEKPHQHK